MKTITKNTMRQKVKLCQRLGGINEYRLVVGYKWIGPYYGRTKEEVLEECFDRLMNAYEDVKEGRL